jgi:hypothetical protein
MMLRKPLLSNQNPPIKLISRMRIQQLKLLLNNKNHLKFWYIQKNKFKKVKKKNKRIR